MSALHDKITSYTHDRGIEFNEAYSLTPTRTGTASLGTYALTNTAPSYSTDGPTGGDGSWRFRIGTTSGQSTMLRSTTANAEFAPFADGLFTVGFWFKLDSLPGGTGTSAATIYSNGTAINRVQVNGSSTTTNPSKLMINFSGSTIAVGPTLEVDRWYFFAVRRFANTTNNMVVYLDGSPIQNLNQSVIQAPTQMQFGNNAAPIGNTTDAFYKISNYFVGDPTVYTEAVISEIWTAGTTAPPATVNFTTTPATASVLSVLPTITYGSEFLPTTVTASALQTEPTIVVQQLGSHTEITTSILVSAEFPPATVSAEIFVNVSVDEPATASVELINNIIAGGSEAVSFSAEEFLASAELVKPFLSESPMIASAESGDHTVYVDPNYFNEVVKLNPYVYINNGGFASAVNYGSQQGTFSRGSDMDGARDGGAPLNMVREGLSWDADGNSFNSSAFINFTTATAAEHPAQLVGNGNFAFEFWSKPRSDFSTYINMPGILLLKQNLPGGFNNPPARIELQIFNGSTMQTLNANNVTSPNNWHHFVINVYQSGTSTTARLVQVWVDGTIKINQTISFNAWTNTNNVNRIIGSQATSLTNISDGFFDEIAWYTAPLTNSQIVNHHQLISTLSPNYTEFTDPGTASAAIGTHQFTVTSNAIPEIKEATASALTVTPTIIAGRSITYNASPATATGIVADPELSLDNTVSADPMIAYAESVNAFHLNSIYADYVKTNINPYRYVTFDSSVPTEDIGTDNDYSVVPTVIGGATVNPDEGINGKSAKTAGTSYVTDGVVLKESEWNDSWGTGQNVYHSSFWIQKAPEDNSTGLRVLWNLNGYLDNQHVILFHRTNKLHMQFNNGSGTHIDAVTTNNINIFDGERHFIVVAFDHTNNNNNTVNLYVDSILVLTVNLGSYTGTTVNGTTFVGPNDEANNHPRLGVGCLITPFGQTALPVVPTNTRLILDEIYWAKTAITQTQVTNLYNIMPDKNNNDSAAEAMTASALMVDPAIVTTVNYVSGVATASALISSVTVIADRNIVNLPLPATASVELLNAQRVNNVIISADVFVVTATFNDAGVVITIPGPTLFASATLASAGIRINGFNPALALSPWAAYLRATDVNNLMVQRGVN
jgi:hypothetical protein